MIAPVATAPAPTARASSAGSAAASGFEGHLSPEAAPLSETAESPVTEDLGQARDGVDIEAPPVEVAVPASGATGAAPSLPPELTEPPAPASLPSTPRVEGLRQSLLAAPDAEASAPASQTEAPADQGSDPLLAQTVPQAAHWAPPTAPAALAEGAPEPNHAAFAPVSAAALGGTATPSAPLDPFATGALSAAAQDVAPPDLRAAAPPGPASPQAAPPVQTPEAPAAPRLDLAAAPDLLGNAPNTPTGPALSADPLPPAPPEALSAPEAKPTAPPPRTTPLLRNVLDRLEEIELGEGTTRLLLRPKGLGVLEVDIARLISGRLHLSIRAENPLLLEALRQESGAMSSYLGERGFDLAGGEPDLGRYQRPAETEAPPRPEGEADPTSNEPAAQMPPAPAAAPRLGAGGLDLVT